MKYMLLIYEAESNFAKLGKEQMGALMGDYRAFSQSIAQSGHYKAGDQLHPVSAATTVRVRNGKRQTTDGPFAETREQLGGYYLVDAKDLDEAIGLAARIPGAQTGSIEVRPVFERTADIKA